jgi:hypothetical protein
MVLKAHSPAIHKLGDIGQSDTDEYIRVCEETKKFYIGHFEEGFGFIGVHFAKTDVRPLTKEEIDDVNKCWYVLAGIPRYKLSFDYEGNVKDDIK